jgi:hypothetical protein
MRDNAPLNGEVTRPLTDHAIERLRSLVAGPAPVLNFNPGVVNRLLRGDGADPYVPYVEIVRLPSPYASHRGADTNFLRITDAGRVFLRSVADEQ